MILASLLLAAASSAAALVPASARAAFLLDGDTASDGFRALLQTAGTHTGMASPVAIGRDLHSAIGVDLLTDAAPWGLAPQGPRAIVFASGSVAFSAKVKDTKAARLRLDAWLAEAATAPARRTRRAPAGRGQRPATAGQRAAMIDRGRLFTGSGPHAAALVGALAHLDIKASLAKDRHFAAALAGATGPAAVFFRGGALLKGGVLALDAGASGLVARGLVLPAGDAPLLVGEAPQDCGAHLACLRAEVGGGGRALVAAAAREYFLSALPAGPRDLFDAVAQAASATAGKLALRVDALDAHLLGDERNSIWALRFSSAAEATATLPDRVPIGVVRSATGLSVKPGERPLCLEVAEKTVALSSPCSPAPGLKAGSENALDASVDFPAIDRALSKLSPLDALRGPVAAGAYGAHLLWGSLLRNAGPLTLTGRPAGPAAAIELRLPLR